MCPKPCNACSALRLARASCAAPVVMQGLPGCFGGAPPGLRVSTGFPTCAARLGAPSTPKHGCVPGPTHLRAHTHTHVLGTPIHTRCAHARRTHTHVLGTPLHTCWAHLYTRAGHTYTHVLRTPIHVLRTPIHTCCAHLNTRAAHTHTHVLRTPIHTCCAHPYTRAAHTYTHVLRTPIHTCCAHPYTRAAHTHTHVLGTPIHACPACHTPTHARIDTHPYAHAVHPCVALAAAAAAAAATQQAQPACALHQLQLWLERGRLARRRALVAPHTQAPEGLSAWLAAGEHALVTPPWSLHGPRRAGGDRRRSAAQRQGAGARRLPSGQLGGGPGKRKPPELALALCACQHPRRQAVHWGARPCRHQV